MNALYISYEKGYLEGEAEIVLGVSASFPAKPKNKTIEDMWYLGYEAAKSKRIQMSPRQFEAYFEFNYKAPVVEEEQFVEAKIVFG